jgi:hypothetical protein
MNLLGVTALAVLILIGLGVMVCIASFLFVWMGAFICTIL